jgi:hypothetical protein
MSNLFIIVVIGLVHVPVRVATLSIRERNLLNLAGHIACYSIDIRKMDRIGPVRYPSGFT